MAQKWVSHCNSIRPSFFPMEKYFRNWQNYRNATQCFMLLTAGDGLAYDHITVFVLDYASPTCIYGHKKSNNTIFLNKLEPLVNITRNANTCPRSQVSVGRGGQAGLI